MLECKQSQIQQFLQIQRQIPQDSSAPIKAIIELIQDLMVTYILTKFGADWLIFGDTRVQSRFQQFFQIQGQITLDVLI